MLKGLQGKTAKDERNAEYPKPSLRKIVGVVFDVRIDRHSHAGDKACYQSHANRKRPGVVHVMDEGTTDQGRDHVADRTDHSSPKLTTRKPWTPRRCIVGGRTHAARVGEYLADDDENDKCDCESEAQNPVQSGSESEPTDGGKQPFPKQGVMIQPTSCSTEFNRQGDTGRDTGSQAKEETEAEAVADAEDNGVRYRTGKQPQRTVLSTQ